MYATIGCFFFAEGLATTTTLCMSIHNIIGDANLEMKKGGRLDKKMYFKYLYKSIGIEFEFYSDLIVIQISNNSYECYDNKITFYCLRSP